jgi:hypothetical protein
MEGIRRTAKRLGNRPATCRTYYVHTGLQPEEECILSVIRREDPI